MSNSSIGNKLDLNNSNLTNNQPEEDDKSSPTSNNQKTAVEAEESEGLPKVVEAEESESLGLPELEGLPESEGQPVVKSGTDLVPLENLVAAVNGNLKDCEWCTGTPLVLELDRRVGFASNWKLTCRSCVKKDEIVDNSIYYLKRSLSQCSDYKERRAVKKAIDRKINERKKKKQKRDKRYITSPMVSSNSTPKHKQRKVMDFAVNVRAVISSFYVGTGGLDIGLINSAQGIEGGENWEKTFTRHSPHVCKAILKVVHETIADALKEEIILTIAEKLDGKYSPSEIERLTQRYHEGEKTGVEDVDNVRISISFDMGWQKKGTGHTYDSNSGHAYYIGVRCQKVVCMVVYSKKCTVCDIAIAMGEEPMEHEDCVRNYRTGSSKAMEATAALELILDLHSKRVGVEFIVSDDDSTMRAHLRHIGSDKGKLPLDVAEPTFLCDPSHRIKVMVKDMFALALMSKTKSECEKIDALRIKKYLGCWVGKSKLLPYNEFKKQSNAPVEHLFGCHEWCDPSWCYAVEIDQARQKYTTAAVTVAPSLPPIATATDGAEVLIRATTEVINPAERVTPLAAVTVAPALPPMATITGGAEVSIRTTTEVINPTASKSLAPSLPPPISTVTGGAEVIICATTQVIHPTASSTSTLTLPIQTCEPTESDAQLNILSDDSSAFSSDSYASSDPEEEIDTYRGTYVEEDTNINFFRDLVPNTVDGLESMVFSTTDLETLKEKEKNLRGKEEGKYFRCKLANPILYGQITAALAPYLVDDKLKMLCHPWSTQLNESMNNSCAAYAPKTKNYCGTISLRTRVGIASGVMALGYRSFWAKVFVELGLDMDSVFESSLNSRDKKKSQKRKRQKSTVGKLKRRKTDMTKFTAQHKEQMEDARTGKTYGAGVALAAATKSATAKLTASMRNPEGTPKELLRCSYYHPLFCTVLGHTSCATKGCGVKHKSKDERKVILATIKRMQIEEELAVQHDGMFYILTPFVVCYYQFHKILTRPSSVIDY